MWKEKEGRALAGAEEIERTSRCFRKGEMDWYLIQCNSDDKWALLFFSEPQSGSGDAQCSSGIGVCGEVAFADN